ncbi:MAG: NUDIX domain-containing protein [Betaproteobacteria bacterium]|jgi:8-oxo-dGTP pyrophosphatase MutT (NUDIX family)|nr:NUDIX domain-containing protein [Betaproteobacteria bacterium]
MRTTRPDERSAGVVVARRAAQGWLVLVLRAYRNWDFPKGLIEPGEAPFDAAVREAREETGIEDLVFRWGEDHRETLPYARNKVARYYLAETQAVQLTLPVNPELGRPEHHEYRWVDFAEARRLLPPRLQSVLSWARSRLAGEL